jgi:hypothetical protein
MAHLIPAFNIAYTSSSLSSTLRSRSGGVLMRDNLDHLFLLARCGSNCSCFRPRKCRTEPGYVVIYSEPIKRIRGRRSLLGRAQAQVSGPEKYSCKYVRKPIISAINTPSIYDDDTTSQVLFLRGCCSELLRKNSTGCFIVYFTL